MRAGAKKSKKNSQMRVGAKKLTYDGRSKKYSQMRAGEKKLTNEGRSKKTHI